MKNETNTESKIKLFTAIIGLATALVGAYFLYTKSVAPDNNMHTKPTHTSSPLEKNGDRNR